MSYAVRKILRESTHRLEFCYALYPFFPYLRNQILHASLDLNSNQSINLPLFWQINSQSLDQNKRYKKSLNLICFLLIIF